MTEFSDALRGWRRARRFSQLDLAGEAGVSARHVSFLETGRARPSRAMIDRLGDALGLPLDARNQLLRHAGFAPRYAARGWDAADMAPIRKAVDHMLTRHAPYPAIALDRLWSVVSMNATARVLYGQVGVFEGDSLLDLLMSDAMGEVVENWPAVAWHLTQRLRMESAAQGSVPEFDRAVAHLSRVPPPRNRAPAPVVPTVLRLGAQRLSMFATIAQFGTPEDVLLDDFKVELYFPADADTAEAFESLARAAGPDSQTPDP